jgi:small neutral amino acid transporter SnatA (MarC family)
MGFTLGIALTLFRIACGIHVSLLGFGVVKPSSEDREVKERLEKMKPLFRVIGPIIFLTAFVFFLWS